MLIIGSTALSALHLSPRGTPKDLDVIGTFKELQAGIKRAKEAGDIKVSEPLDDSHWHIQRKDGYHTEFEIAWPGSSGEALLEEYDAMKRGVVANAELCLALKLSHRYKKNSPHFLKTMRDIQHLRASGVTLTRFLREWLPLREAETYVYSHPKLNVGKAEFFTDDVPYIFDHDSIHEAVALNIRPAYMEYMEDGAAVMTSRE